MCFFAFFGAKIWPAAAGTGELARDLRDQTRVDSWLWSLPRASESRPAPDYLEPAAPGHGSDTEQCPLEMHVATELASGRGEEAGPD